MSSYPTDWTESTLEGIVSFKQGTQVPVEDQSEIKQEGMVRFLRIVDYLSTNSPEPRYFLPPSKATFADKLDVIMVRYGDAGRVVRGFDGVFANNLFSIKPTRDIILKTYLYELLNFDLIQQHIQNLVTVTTMPQLGHKDLYKLKVHFPRVDEQKKIAEILTSVDKVIELTEIEIEKLKNLKKGMMQDLLTKGIGHTKFKDSPIGKISESWELVRFGEVINLRHGYQFRDEDFTERGIKVVKIGTITKDGNLNLDGASTISSNRVQEFSNIILKDGDVLMALTGATLGKAAIVKGVRESIVQNYRVGHFSAINDQNLDNQYLYYSLANDLFLRRVLSLINEGAQPNVGKAELEKLKYALPPINEQKKIVASLVPLDVLIDVKIKKLNKVTEMKKGLMQDLLTGKVRVKV